MAATPAKSMASKALQFRRDVAYTINRKVAQSPSSIVLPPWQSAVQPNFMNHAKKVVLEVLQPGVGMNNHELWEAVQKVHIQMPEVLVPEPYAPEVRKLKDWNPSPAPPRPDHPFRSMSHMKKEILPKLEGERFLQKVHRKRVLTPEEVSARRVTLTKGQKKSVASSKEQAIIPEWVWMLPNAEHEVARREARDLAAARLLEQKIRDERVNGWELGVGQDVGHLNRRRGENRERKIRSEVHWATTLGKARKEDLRAWYKTPEYIAQAAAEKEKQRLEERAEVLAKKAAKKERRAARAAAA